MVHLRAKPPLLRSSLATSAVDAGAVGGAAPLAAPAAPPPPAPAAPAAPAAPLAARPTTGDALGRFAQGGARADAAEPEPLRQARARGASEALFTAMKGGVWGVGTDERALFAALTSVPPEDLPLVRAHYQAHYGRDLDRDVRGELSKADKKRATALLRGQAELADAIALREALRGLRKDPGTALMILERAAQTGKSRALAKAFLEHTGTPLDARLRAALSGPRAERAAALLVGDLATARAHLVREVLGQKPSKIQDGVLLGLLRRDGPALAARYQKLYGEPLAEALKSRLPALLAAQATAALGGDEVGLRAVGLRRVVLGEGRFEPTDALAALLGGLDAAGRAAVESDYQRRFGRALTADAAQLAPDVQAALTELRERGELSLATELWAARRDPARLLALLDESTPAARAAARQQHRARHREDLDTAITRGLDGLDRLRVRYALEGPPANLDAAVARLRELRDHLRAGVWNVTSQVVMDWVLLSKKGSRLDASVARAEAALEAAARDGVITPEEHADVTALINYGASDLDTYRDAVHRVSRVTTGVAGTLAATTTVALTAGAGSPLAVQVAAASLAGGTAATAAAAVTGGRLYTLERLRHEFGLGALNGAATVLGRAAVAGLDTVLSGVIADKVLGATLDGGTSAVRDTLTQRLAADFAINSYDPLRALYGVATGAVRGAVSFGVARAAMTAVDQDTWRQGAQRGVGRLLHAATAGLAQGAINGSLAAVVSLAISGLEYTSTLPEAEQRQLLHPVTVTTPDGPQDVVVVGHMDAARLEQLRDGLQKMSDATHGEGVRGLEQIHVFALGSHSTGMCLGPTGFAVAPDLDFSQLVHTAWHESGHRLHTQIDKLLSTLLHDHPFGKPPYVSEYASTNLYEDVACTHERVIRALVGGTALDLDPTTNPLAPKLSWVMRHMYPELLEQP